MLLVVLLVAGAAGHLESTTTKTYDIEVPGSNPIRIVEGEPLWSTTPKTVEHRAFSTDTTEDPLHRFLSHYAETVHQNKKNHEETDDHQTENVQLIKLENTEKAKSWDMLPYQRHNHPYDDKKGWVSMEPVPWSVSKISKWQSKYKPDPKPWDEYDSLEPQSVRPWNRPTTNNYDIYYPEKKPEAKPIYSKPTAVYNQKVHVDYGNRYHHKHDENCNNPKKTFYNDGEIITDGLPSNFPQPYQSNRRHATDIHPDTHPFSGDGEWVLLSTTKGYKYPKQQRSLQINPESVGAHRSVRLTVLPPLKNSKVNMTTSHGGLLQVESTFQTVEQSRRQYTKKQKLKKKQQAKPAKPVRQVAAPTVTTTRRNTGPDSSAVLAAVGAGMIPATMAMLVPMALGGRRKRELVTSTPKYLQITLPRNLY